MPTKPILRLLLLLLSLGAMAVSAKTINDAKSVISVDLPDDWKFEESKIGGNPSTTATSDDGLLIVVMRIERKLPQEVMKRFADEMDALMPDAKFGDDADKITVHGLQADKLTGHAKRGGQTVKFTAVLVSSGGVGTIAVIAVGSETPFKRHLRDIDAALDSIRPKE